MSLTLDDIYTQVVTLPPTERLRLVTLILNNLVQAQPQVVEQSDTWTEQDQQNLAIFSLQSLS